MPSQAYFRHDARYEAPFNGPNQQNVRQFRQATQVLHQALQEDRDSAAQCPPWRLSPPKPSFKPMSAKSIAVLERFRQKHAGHVEPFSLPSWQDRSRLQPTHNPAPSHHMKQTFQGHFYTRQSPVQPEISHAGYGPETTSRPVTYVPTAPVHGRPADTANTRHPQWPAANGMMSEAIPDLPTERLTVSAAKTRIHQILHRDGARRGSQGRGTEKVLRAGGSSLKRQLSVNNGDGREELALLALTGNWTNGNNNSISRPSKRVRKRAGQ